MVTSKMRNQVLEEIEVRISLTAWEHLRSSCKILQNCRGLQTAGTHVFITDEWFLFFVCYFVHFQNNSAIILASPSDRSNDNLNLGKLYSFFVKCIFKSFLGNYYSVLHLENLKKKKKYLNLLVCLGNVYKET